MDIAVERLEKRFGGTVALNDVTVRIAAGTIHGLVGENGAGKSTLGKIIGGALRPDAGVMRFDERPVSLGSPSEGIREGVALVAQELALVGSLSVQDNVFLGAELRRGPLLDREATRRTYLDVRNKVGFGPEPGTRVSQLPIGEKQKVEILRAVATGANTIVFDEPTAALSPHEKETFLQMVRDLRSDGMTMILVSHFIDEIMAVTDSVTVLRDGEVAWSGATSTTSENDIVRAMIGRRINAYVVDERRRFNAGRVVLEADGISTRRGVTDVSLQVHAGEIVALAGLIGSGRTEVARAIFGADPLIAGTVRIDGQLHANPTPVASVKAGLGMVPEDRKTMGLHVLNDVIFNISLPYLSQHARLGVPSSDLADDSERVAKSVDVKYQRLTQRVAELSGGNQQKVLFAKWLLGNPVVLIVDEPTRGVDIGAKHAIYDLLRALADSGVGLLLISSELEEVRLLADRILVMRSGNIVDSVLADEMETESVLRAALGLVPTHD